MNPNDWNPRFVAYAKSNGLTPEQQLAKDRSRYPGGCMAGFITWIQDKARKFVKQHHEFSIGPYVSNHEEFTKFLFRENS